MKQKSINKTSSTDRTKFKTGEKLYMDISTVKGTSAGGSKYWAMWVDERWRGKFSRFLRNKSAIATVVKQLIEELKDKYNITVKVIRCDNAGEKKSLRKELSGKNIKFECTASGTPQQNGVVERAFATLYNRIRLMMHSAGIGKEMRKKL